MKTPNHTLFYIIYTIIIEGVAPTLGIQKNQDSAWKRAILIEIPIIFLSHSKQTPQKS
jgi:hypothetical protein